MSLNILKRPRRNRRSLAIRALNQETSLTSSDLIAPFFLIEGTNKKESIPSMPSIYRWSEDLLLFELENILEVGIQSIMLFPVIDSSNKDSFGTYALNHRNFLYKSIRSIKKTFPEICVIGDLALDPYTDSGHDGILDPVSGEVLNDETVCILGQKAIMLAEAGADIVAPSDMMDGRVRYIRSKLDQAGLTSVLIMSYSAKYASSFYSPFRDALSSHPAYGGKMGYQMNPKNALEAILECVLDEEEGADILMIKPAGYYLDILKSVREKTLLPLAAYQVSGEYSMLSIASQKGFLDKNKAFYESMICIKRAGASMIVSYASKDVATLIKLGENPLEW
ncbi:porphobilinogen synthase [Chlamydiifrater phoenicopteri]|uniref:porphobilinogen synthase n=1 Tax=Chlamydiifrater phoenicopteri TaxID=2681469 RepID=UPI001BD1661F|nr:porphobilinogen synthase [Chlamydiifrater phoenicopteri]